MDTIKDQTERMIKLREDYLAAYHAGKRVEYRDAWVGWTVAILYSVKTAPLEDLRIKD